MSLTFGTDRQYVSGQEVVAFSAWDHDDERSIRCAVTAEALTDHLGSDARGDEILAIYDQIKGEVHWVAERKVAAGQVDENGVILVTTWDLAQTDY